MNTAERSQRGRPTRRRLGWLLAIGALLAGTSLAASAAPDLSVSFSPAPDSHYVPSQSQTVTVLFKNGSGGTVTAATGAALAASLPSSGVSISSVSCSATAGSSCDSATALPTSASIAVGGTLTVVVTLDFDAAATGDKTATFTGSATGATSASASHTFERTPATDLSASASAVATASPVNNCPADSGTYTPGCAAQYQVVFENEGPDAANGARLSIARSEAAAGAFTLSCSGTGGATCPSNTAGPLGNVEVTSFPSGGKLTFTVTVQHGVSDSHTSVGVTGSIALPDPSGGLVDLDNSNDSSTSTGRSRRSAANLKVTTTALATGTAPNPCHVDDGHYTPGCAANYEVKVTNAGPDAASNFSFSMARAEAAGAAISWTCTASAGSACPAASGSTPIDQAAVASLPLNGTLTYAVSVSHGSGELYPEAGLDASIALSGSAADPVDINHSDNQSSQSRDIARRAALRVVKRALVNGVPITTIARNASFDYEITLYNDGPSDIGNADADPGTPEKEDFQALLSDTFSSELRGASSEQCTPTGNAPCWKLCPSTLGWQGNEGGSGTPIAGTGTGNCPVDLVLGNGVQIAQGFALRAGTGSRVLTRVVVPLTSSATSVANTVTVAVNGCPSGMTCTAVQAVGDPDDRTSGVTVGVIDTAKAEILAENVGAGSAVPGALHSYKITVINSGYEHLPSVAVTGQYPMTSAGNPIGFVPGTVFVQCRATGGACCNAGGTCGTSADTPKVYADQLSATAVLPAATNSQVVYTVTGMVDPRATGSMGLDASAQWSSSGTDSSHVDTTLVPDRRLAIHKRLLGRQDAGGVTTLSYEITASNTGPSHAPLIDFIDPVVPGTDFDFTQANWTCTAVPVPAPAVAPEATKCSAPAGSGPIEAGDLALDLMPGARAVVAISVPVTSTAGAQVTNTARVMLGGSTKDSSVTTTLQSSYALNVDKDDDLNQAHPGSAHTYAISVANEGPDDAYDVHVTDIMPGALQNVEWTCAAVSPVPGNLTAYLGQDSSDPLMVNPAGRPGQALALSADGRHAYVVGRNVDDVATIFAYVRNATPGLGYGAIALDPIDTEVEGVDDASDTGAAVANMGHPIDLALRPDGAVLYVLSSNAGQGSIAAFHRVTSPLDPEHGRLSYAGSVLVGIDQPRRLVASADRLYVAGSNSGSGQNLVQVYRFDSSNQLPIAVPAAGAAAPVSAGPMAIDTAGSRLFVASTTTSAVMRYDIAGPGPNAGALTPSGTPLGGAVVGLAGIHDMVLAGNGRDLYVHGGSGAAARIGYLKSDATGLSVALLPGLDATGTDLLGNPVRLALSPDGEHLLGVNQVKNALFSVRRNPVSGGLSVNSGGLLSFQEVLRKTGGPGAITASALDLPSALAVTPDNRHVIVTSASSAGGTGPLVLFSRRAPPPQLGFIERDRQGEAGIDALTAPADLISRDGDVYVLSQVDSSITLFKRRPALAGTDEDGRHLEFSAVWRNLQGGITNMERPDRMLLSSDGKTLFVTSLDGDSLAVFRRNAADGTLVFATSFTRTSGSGHPGLLGALGMAMDPDAGYLYVAGSYEATIAIFQYQPASPQRVSYIGSVAGGQNGVTGMNGIRDLVVAGKDGQFQLLGVAATANTVVVFNQTAGGQLQFVHALSLGANQRPMALALSPSINDSDNTHVYVVSQNSSSLHVLQRILDTSSPQAGRVRLVSTLKAGIGAPAEMAGPRDVVVSGNGKRVYVAAEYGSSLVAFDRYDNTGSANYGGVVLAEVRTQDVDAVDGIRSPYAVAVSGDSRNVYLAGFGSDAVASFSVGTGSSCSATGSGDIDDMVTIRAGGAVLYTVHSVIRPDATGTLENLAEASGAGGLDFDSDTTDLIASARLELDKTNDQIAVIPGTEVTYQLTVRNKGPGNLTGLGNAAQLNVADLFGCTPASGGFDCSASPFEPGSISWTCAASGSGSLDFLAAYRDGQGGVEGLAGLGSLALIARGDSAADPTAVRENFLVGASVDDDAVVFLQRNAMTGALTFHSRIDNAAGVPLEGARAVVVGGAGKLLFVVSRRSDSLNVFSLSGDATHPLIVTHRASLKNPAIAGLDQALHLVVLPADSDGDGTPDTDHVYVAGANDHAVAAFAYNRAAGTLGHLGSLVNGQGGVLGLADVEYLVASPDGAHVYAISGSDASVTQLLRNRTSGSPDFGKLGFVARFSGSILGASMQGASAAVFEEHGKRMYLTAGDANRVIVLNRVDDPGAGNFGSLSLASSLGQGEQGARGLLNPRRLQLSQDGQHLYVTSQAGNTLAWFSIHPQTGALAYLGIRSNHSGGIEGLGGATGLVLDPVLDQIYVAGTLDGAIAHFQRQSDSWCPASGTGPLGVSDSSGVPVNIAAGGQVVFRLTARVASGLTGNLSNVAHVNWQSANCTGGQGTALTACSLDAEDIDTPSSQADLSITKDDGLAELDGLAGAAALAADVHNLYVAAASDHAIGAFRRETGANGGIGLRQVGFVRSGGAGVSGIAAVSDLVVSADGRNLYAASPVDNAVTSFVREPGNGALSQIDLDQNGLLGVTGLSGARALALSPDGEHVYVAGGFSNAVAIFRRQTVAGAADAGTLSFVGMVQAGVGGVSGIESPRALEVSGDGEHLYVVGDSGSLVAFKRNTIAGSANFGLLTQMNPTYQNGTGAIVGMDGLRSLALSADGTVLWVLGSEAGTLVRFLRNPADGRLEFAPHPGASAVFQTPELDGATRLRLGSDGRLYAAATAIDGVAVFTLDAGGVPTLAALVRNGDVPPNPALPRVDGLGGATDVAYVDDGQGWLYAIGSTDSALAAFAQSTADPDYLGALFDGMGGVAPGDAVTYTIEVTNNGPSGVAHARVQDIFPPEFEQVSWTCIGYGGGNCAPSGQGNLDLEVGLPAGSHVQFLATGVVRSKAVGRLVNTATVEGIGVLDAVPGNNSATDGDTVLTPALDLSIQVDDNGCTLGDPGCTEMTEATPGGPIGYRVVAANAGPTYAGGAVLDDTLPAALYDVAWSCTPTPQAGLLAQVALAAPDFDIAYRAIAVDAIGQHAYAVGQVDDGSGPRDTLVAFRRDPITGALSWLHAYVDGVAGTAPGGGAEPMVSGITGAVDVVLAPDGRFVYVAGRDADAIAAFSRDPASGLLTWQSKVQDGELGVDGIGGISTLAMAPDGRHLYAGGAADRALAGFSVNPATGALTQIALLRQGQGGVNGLNGVSDLGFSLNGELLFATATVNRSVTAFRRVPVNGAISHLVGIEEGQVGVNASLGSPSALAVDADQVFVADALGDAVNRLRFVDGASPEFVLEEVIALDSDATPGTQQPVALAYVPDQARLYVASAASGQLHLYSLLDAQAEALASYDSAHTAAAAQPSALALSPDRRQLYLTSAADGVVASLAREHGSRCPLAGEGPLAGVRVDVAPGGSVQFDLTARIFANASGPLTYAAGIDPRVLAHETNPVDNRASDTDDLVPAPDLETAKQLVTPAANVVAGLPVSYAITSVNHGVSDALGARIEDDLPLFPTVAAGLVPDSGAWSCAANLPLAAAGGLSTALDPRVADLSALAATPDGRRWFGVSQSGNALVDVALDAAGDIASLTRLVDGDPAGSGTVDGLQGASHLAVSPDGEHLYVTGAGSNSVLTFRILPSGLEFLRKHTSGSDGVSGLIGVRYLVISRDGRFVYTAAVPGSASNSAIALFRRDADSGALTFVERIQDGLGTFQPDSNVIRGVKRLHLSDDGLHLYALATGSQALSRFEINPNTGVLRYAGVLRGTGSSALPALAGVQDMVATPADGQLYVLSSAGITAFARALNGSLAVGATWAVPDPASARSLAIDTWGSRLYLADAQGSVQLYVRRWIDGALEPRFTLAAASAGEAAALLHVPAIDQLLLAQPGATGGLARIHEQPISRCLSAAGGNADLPVTIDLGVAGSSALNYAATVHPSARGQLLNVARAVPGTGADPDPVNNDGASQTQIHVISDLSIGKTGPASAVAGEIAEYVITVNNAGPSDALGVYILDPLDPTRFAGATWTCAAAGGSSCAAASGSGSSLDAQANVMVGGSVTVTLRAKVHPRWIGALQNAAYVQPEPGAVDPTPGDQVAPPVTTVVVRRPNLSITKTNGVASSVAGLPVNYTLGVHNAGPSDAPSARIEDLLPASLLDAAWTCTPTLGTGNCTPLGDGSINEVVDIPVGETLVYQVTATLASSATGSLSNTASVQALGSAIDPDTSDNQATDTDAIETRADLAVVAHAPDRYDPGSPVAMPYRVEIANSGPSDSGPSVAALSFSHPVQASGAGCSQLSPVRVDCSFPNIQAGTTAIASLALNQLPAVGATLTSGVQVAAQAADPVAGNNASSTSTLMFVGVDLDVSIDDGRIGLAPADTSIYVIRVRNVGSVAAVNARVESPLAPELLNATWQCVAGTGAFCNGAGSGGIDEQVDIPPGGMVTFTLTATVDPTIDVMVHETVVQGVQATANPAQTEVSTQNNTAADTNQIFKVIYKDGFEDSNRPYSGAAIDSRSWPGCPRSTPDAALPSLPMPASARRATCGKEGLA